MILPCVHCLKLPLCVNTDIKELTSFCKDLKSFIRSRRGMTKIIRDITIDIGECKLKSQDQSPKICIEYYEQ